MSDPKTLAEQLDAAASGEEFGNILGLFITALGQVDDE